MRVSTATSSRSDSRMFSVVVQGYGSAQPRNAERTITVPFSRLQNLMQSISQLGGKVLSVSPGGEAPAQPVAAAAPAPVSMDEDQRPVSRVTGEGNGSRITGDDWDRGDRVTGTEGLSARRRNPTRVGPMSAMAGMQRKRNEEIPAPTSKVTGSSGSTDQGSLITVSGGARG